MSIYIQRIKVRCQSNNKVLSLMNTKISLPGSILNNHVPLGSFNCAKFEKKIHSTDSEILRYAIFVPKMAHLPRKRIFFRKSVNTHCSFHSCISTFEKSKLDVNPLLKYEGAAFSHTK